MRQSRHMVMGGWAARMGIGATLLGFATALAPGAAAETFDCVMDPSLVVRLAGPVGGIVEHVAVERGDEVRRGDLVARLSSTVERETETLLAIQAENDSAIAAQRARLGFLDKRLERSLRLAQSGVTTPAALEEIEAEAEASRNLLRQAEMERAIARQELVRAQAALALREIRSPITGLVTERALSAGEYLQPEAHVATIVQLDPVYVETFLPVAMFASVRIGDVAQVRPAPPVTSIYEATVIAVDRVFDPASGTFGVRLALPNPEFRLPAGHRCELEIGAVPTE